MRALSCRSALAVAAVWILSADRIGASDTVTIAMNTTVLPVCRFSASSPELGSVAGGATGPASATGTITYRCTNGLAPTFAITAICDGCDGRDTAPVIVSDEGGVGRGMGSGRDLTLVVVSPFAPVALQTASASLSSGAISVTVSP
jgi:hypothetical protein